MRSLWTTRSRLGDTQPGRDWGASKNVRAWSSAV
jgi:hypothetical protein